MTLEEQFEHCVRQAEQITARYREDCPANYDPKSWYVSTTLIVLAIVSAAVSAYGSYASSEAQKDAANYNAAVARNNADSASQQAQFDASMIRDKNRRILAQQRSAFAANGIVADSGSAADVSADSAQQGEMQALMAIYTGKTSSNAYEAQARLDRMNANSAQAAGIIGVGSSVLGGATNVGMIYGNPNFKH